MPDIYRACASIVIFQKGDESNRILILHKPRKKDAWQLPQGGVDEGETFEHAVVREVKEEAGIDVEIIGKSDTIYQYDFPGSYRKFRPDNVCGQRLEFFFGVVEKDTEIDVDEDEIDGFVWVVKEEIGNYIKRKEYLEIINGLVDEGVRLLNG